MHDPKVYELFGLTKSRLRQIFTATEGADADIRKKAEKRINARVLSSVKRNAGTSRKFQAVDMAMDGAPIQKDIIPLLLWAQGKVSTESVSKLITDNPELKKYITTNSPEALEGSNGQRIQLSLPKIYETPINLVRSYTTRRLASQEVKYANMWPLLKYEPRGTSEASKLIGDIVSQEADRMAEDYNYRHFFTQCDRSKLSYGFSCIFPRSAWDRRTGWRIKETNLPEDVTPTENDVESYTEAEGVDFVEPHASRVAWDTSAPLANINTNNGPKWILYWDMVNYGALRAGPYYNLDRVSHGDGFYELMRKEAAFFEYYFDPTTLKLPDTLTGNDISSGLDTNDRTTNVGMYSEQTCDNGVLHTQYFECVNPKALGICAYDCEIWLRYTVAGDGTILYCEPLPSIPCAYGGINQIDSRIENSSFAMELLVYQDQCTNIISQMIANIRTSMVQLWLLDSDAIDEEVMKYLENGAKVKDFFTDPKIVKYSATKMRELGIQDPRQAFAIIQAQVPATIQASLSALGQLLQLCDRLANVSRNELGESNPREISATETQEISTTTQTMHTFISDGIDEQRSAVKRMIYEARIAHGSSDFSTPVMGRYTAEAVKLAGFKADAVPDEKGLLPKKVLITGKARRLVYSFFFDSRDGSERASNPQSAQVLTNLAQMLMSIPPIAQKMGMRRIYDLFNTIIRLSGAGWDLKLELDPSEDEQINPEDAPQLIDRIAKLEQIVQQIIQMPLPQGAPQGPAVGAPQPPPAGALPQPAQDDVAAALISGPAAA